MELLDYFRGFENTDGLLENLESWVFVEHSKANDFVQDVNYPTNALYAATLESAARLFNRPVMKKRADRIREVIRRQSYDGTFFTDNAIRKNGGLKNTGNHTEVCQYYMFYFGVATPESHPDLYAKLCNSFGPGRDPLTVYPGVYPANAFIGNYLRLELLSRAGDCNQIRKEIVDFFYPMSTLTGTLWEHMGTQASCNHGFASHTAHSLYRDILGIYRVDQVRKKVTFRFQDVGLDWCEGRVMTGDGPVELTWRRENNRLQFEYSLPAGYTLAIENIGDLELRMR
jgi:alpha-L-rhamnosidase